MAFCWNVVCYSKKESQEILKCIVSLSLVGKKTTIKTNHTNIEHSPSSRGVQIVRLGGEA